MTARRHPDRGRWYFAALISIVVALALAAGTFFLTVALPAWIWGNTVGMWWPWIGIPLGALLALLSLASLRVLPQACYRLVGGRVDEGAS